MGGINFFNDKAQAPQAMIRVAKPETKVVIVDETEQTTRRYSESRACRRSGFVDGPKRAKSRPLLKLSGFVDNTLVAMHAETFFRGLVGAQKNGRFTGISSICSSHRFVLEAAILQAAADGLPLLVESTVNQVNQFGGYSAMRPTDFRNLVESVAASLQFPKDRIILGADHLGPYPWRMDSAPRAMAKAEELVAESVRAGYSKIHLDASMLLAGDDAASGGLDPRTAADRQGHLAARAELSFDELLRKNPGASPPVYVIGTDVPPPGGIRSSGEAVPVTQARDFLDTVDLCKEAFLRRGLNDAWSRVCAVVAQPGVEYGDHGVHDYDPARAADLIRAARECPGIVIEGHSTDYQKPALLRRLVQDGVAILKVGPALTFALRECLFSLELIERELLPSIPGASACHLADTLEQAMINDPRLWEDYYQGTESEKRLARKYSYSDRSRYYWNVPAVKTAMDRLLSNLAATPIPLSLLSQFLPLQYQTVREGRIVPDVTSLLHESVRIVLRGYSEAVR
jgi:D-tagatose-1,6-bisphosphate aldolase subunit GatZ/KbaZ